MTRKIFCWFPFSVHRQLLAKTEAYWHQDYRVTCSMLDLETSYDVSGFGFESFLSNLNI